MKLFILVIILFITSCSKENENKSSNVKNNCSENINRIETDIKNTLDSLNTDTDFTLYLKSKKGKTFIYNRGNSSEYKIYRSASTSKMVTASIILSLVKANILSLNDKPQKYISFWPTTGNLSEITLKSLLNFTSGLKEEPLCINSKFYDFENCVRKIIDKNPSPSPFTEFYYSSTHLQVAGLMAIKALGVSSWQEVYNQFRNDTGLFSNSKYDLPSESNPRLAGGMHWNANDYIEFLDAIFCKKILNEELITLMTSDQIGNTEKTNSPAYDIIGEPWRYGLGVWIECKNENCDDYDKISSPGSYGAYPFIDYKYKYYGILAREGKLKTFAEGYNIIKQIEPLLQDWSQTSCEH